MLGCDAVESPPDRGDNLMGQHVSDTVKFAVVCPSCHALVEFYSNIMKVTPEAELEVQGKTMIASASVPVSKPSGFQEVTQPQPAQAAKKAGATVPELLANLPEGLAGLIKVFESDEAIMVKPQRFLGRSQFSALNMAVKAWNGKYVSAGKDSHFIIPKSLTMKEGR